jgi:hypothetical protein
MLDLWDIMAFKFVCFGVGEEGNQRVYSCHFLSIS